MRANSLPIDMGARMIMQHPPIGIAPDPHRWRQGVRFHQSYTNSISFQLKMQITRVKRMLIVPIAALVVGSGCSGLEPTPMMPSYPAPVGGPEGVPWELDGKCRQQAYRMAERVRRANLNREVAYTLIGIAAGVAIGSALSYDVEGGYYHGHHSSSWHHGHRRYPDYSSYRYRRDYRGAGAVMGAATGAVLSQDALRNPQRTYDIVYENCIRNSWGYGPAVPSGSDQP